MGMVLVGIGAGAVSGATFGGVLASMFGNSSPFFVVAFLLVVDTFLIMIEKTGEVQEPPAVDLEDMGNTPHTEEASPFHLLRADRHTIWEVGVRSTLYNKPTLYRVVVVKARFTSPELTVA